MIVGEADIPEDRHQYAEVMYVYTSLNKKKKKKKKRRYQSWATTLGTKVAQWTTGSENGLFWVIQCRLISGMSVRSNGKGF